MPCCVPDCDSAFPWGKRKEKLSFHKFPIDYELTKKWIVAIGRKDPKTGKYWIPNKNSIVCSLHFSPRQFNPKTKNSVTLKPGSIPYIFPDFVLPESGTLIDEKELALVDFPEEKHAEIVEEIRKKWNEKKVKRKNKSETKSNTVSITTSNDSDLIRNTKKRSFSEINSSEGELVKRSKIINRKLSKTNVTDDESDKGSDLECGLPNSYYSGDEAFETNKNKPSIDNTRHTFCTINSSPLLTQDNIQIVNKEASLNISKTNSGSKIVELSLSQSENNKTNDKGNIIFQPADAIKVYEDIQIINEATSSNESNIDPVIKIVKIPLSLPKNSKILKIQIPSSMGLNKNSTFLKASVNSSTKTNMDVLPMQSNDNSTKPMEQQKNSFSFSQSASKKKNMIPPSGTFIESTLENSINVNLSAVQGTSSTTIMKGQSKFKKLLRRLHNLVDVKKVTEMDKTLLTRLNQTRAEQKRLANMVSLLEEEYENLFCSDESIEEKISMYGIKELEKGIANGDKKALFLYDQLCNLTKEKTTWSDSSTEFVDNLEESLPACYNFIKKANIINLPPSKQQRGNNDSQT